ncbi:hypothetical protein [Beijerinckia indica]|uniref:hypothetical protein n=1 Tax=Beijerinckia indica TaxID=533 RepID=UPI0005A03920|nr:hypothetical protein [Beijerinckia indica]
MSEDSITIFLSRLKEQSFGRCSDTYRWLRKHHEPLNAAFNKNQPAWRVVAEILTEAGIVGARGQKLSAKPLRRMWLRVCRDIEDDKRFAATGISTRKHYPSQASSCPQPKAAALSSSPPAIPSRTLQAIETHPIQSSTPN